MVATAVAGPTLAVLAEAQRSLVVLLDIPGSSSIVSEEELLVVASVAVVAAAVAVLGIAIHTMRRLSSEHRSRSI